jgi:FkbM family methyltransferase
MRKIRLGDGTVVFGRSKLETDFLFREIFEYRCYLKNGLSLKEGDCVFDVGANIGMATLFFHRACPAITVFAFEPVRETFDVLEANAAAHSIPARLFCMGIHRTDERVRFAHYPRMSLYSNMRADPDEDRKHVATVGRNTGTPAPQIDLVLSRLQPQFVDCEVRTLTRIIREQQVQDIALLKIDVEGSELAVLEGLSKQDWDKIRQVVIEVHDENGALENMLDVFRVRGYHVVVEQAPYLAGSSIYNLYARRV